MKKKFLSVATASVMAVSMLAGCGSDDASNNAPAESSSAAAESSAATESSTAESSAAAEDSNLLPALSADEQGKPGACTVPRSNYVQYPYEGAEGITLKYWMNVPSNVQNNPATAESVQMTMWAQRWQELTGVTVEFTGPTSNNDEAFNLMTVSTELPDIIEWEWTSSYPGGPAAAAEEGVLIYLDDYITPDGPAADLWQYLQDNPELDKAVKDDDGHYYCFPFIRGSKYLQTTSGPIVRADLLAAAGYTKEDLVTIDDWTEVMTALKNNGVEKPITFQDKNYMMNCFTGSYGVRTGMYINLDDNAVHYGLADEGYKEFLKQMRAWVEAGILDADVLTNDSKIAQQYMLDGTSAATYGAGGSRLGTWNKTAWAEPDTYGADYELVAVQFPVLNEGDPVNYSGGSTDYSTSSKASAVITADCQYPEVAAAFLNFAYSQTGHYEINFGEEGVSYTMDANGDTEYTDLVNNNPDGLSQAVAMAYYGRANMSGAFVQDPNYIFGYYAQQQQKDALYMWNDGTDPQGSIIPPITMTQDESSEFAKLSAEISTAVDEFRAKCFTGEQDIDAGWDAYVEQLNGMGLQRMIEIEQAAVDRYNAR